VFYYLWRFATQKPQNSTVSKCFKDRG